MQQKTSGLPRGGMHIQVRRASGEVVDFGTSVQGDWLSQLRQTYKILRYRLRVKLGGGA